MEDDVTSIEGSTDINQALREFVVQSRTEQVNRTVIADKDSKSPLMVRLVIKLSGGLIKEQQQAELVLLSFMVVAIVISLILFFNVGRSPSPPPRDKIIWVAGPGN